MDVAKKLQSPNRVASSWHQLGVIFEQIREWDEAERHSREAARLKEANGFIGGANGAVSSWHQLGSVNSAAGRPELAEGWYRKALEAGRSGGGALGLSRILSNLANLLQTEPERLVEARKLAEESLALKQSVDPGASEIWRTYYILGQIADKEAALTTNRLRKAKLLAKATTLRQDARAAKMAHADTQFEIRAHLPLVFVVVRVTQRACKQESLHAALSPTVCPSGMTSKSLSIALFLASATVDTLCVNLKIENAMIIETILTALANPEAVASLIPPDFSLD